jgi:diguanylate cyclase (GGDEF)-like protein
MPLPAASASIMETTVIQSHAAAIANPKLTSQPARSSSVHSSSHPTIRSPVGAPGHSVDDSAQASSPDGVDDPAHMRVAQSLLALLVYAVFAAVHEIEVGLGLVDATLARALSAFMLCGGVAFYALVRGGVNQRRFYHATIVQAQCLFGVLCATLAYAINGPTRGAALLISLVILVFGMFALQPREARRVGVVSLLMSGIVMAGSSWADVAGREPAVELVHFLFVCIGVSTVLILSDRLGGMRATLAAQKSQLEDALARLHELASRDELTGLVNRRHMSLQFEDELARHERSGESMAVALLDIDFFKQVNDRHGHRVGDGVLKTFARVAAEGLRETDLLARWGGEEFLLLMPTTPEAMATSVLERLRMSLLNVAASAVHPELRVTFSAGVAMLEPGDTVQSLVERADHAMYQAKQQGRAQTVVHAGASRDA